MTLIVFNFIVLLTTQIIYKRADVAELYKSLTVGAFATISIIVTCHVAGRTQRVHHVKHCMQYRYDEEDICFENTSDVLKVAFTCMIAAILCGCTGIAGGMVLGPLFMSYGMNPQVMAATNQYITMVSAIAVALQFAMLNDMIWPYACVFGVSTIIAAFIGIRAVQCYIQSSGKESIIALLLIIVLSLALVSIPIKRFLLTPKTHAAASADLHSVSVPAH